jgi:type IX secretion system PorP/SprF family membrane protein
MNREHFLIWVILIFSQGLFAQDQANFTQFYLNPYLLNPSYVGIDGRPSLTLTYRKQWATIKDGPQIGNVTFHSPISRRLSFGLSATDDQKGLLQNSGIMLSFGYNVPLSPESFIRFGLSGGITSNTVDLKRLEGFNDQALARLLENNMSVNGNAGISFHLHSFHAGVSLPNIFEPSFVSQDEFTITKIDPFQSLVFHFSNRFYFANNHHVFEPYVLYRMANGLAPQFEVAGVLHLNHIVWVGGSFKQDFGISGLGGIKLKNTLAIGASYSIANSGENQLNSPTYEISLGLLLGKRKKDTPVYSFVNTEKEKLRKGTGKSASEMLAEKHRKEELAKRAQMDAAAKKKEQDELNRRQAQVDAQRQREAEEKKRQEELKRQQALAQQQQSVKPTTPVQNNVVQNNVAQNNVGQNNPVTPKPVTQNNAQSAADIVRKQQEEQARLQREEAARREQEELARKQQEELARKQQEELARKQQEELARKQQEELARKQQEELARKQRDEERLRQMALARQQEADRKRAEEEAKQRALTEQEQLSSTIKKDTMVITHKPRFNHIDATMEVLNVEVTEHNEQDEKERIARLTLHAADPDEHHTGETHPNGERHEFVRKGEHKEELDVADYVVTGVFAQQSNAKHFSDGLRKLGFKADYGHLTEKAVWYVYLFQGSDINEARTQRDRYRKMKIFRDAWLLTVHH